MSKMLPEELRIIAARQLEIESKRILAGKKPRRGAIRRALRLLENQK